MPNSGWAPIVVRWAGYSMRFDMRGPINARTVRRALSRYLGVRLASDLEVTFKLDCCNDSLHREENMPPIKDGFIQVKSVEPPVPAPIASQSPGQRLDLDALCPSCGRWFSSTWMRIRRVCTCPECTPPKSENQQRK